jgi:hypothetical protein
MGSANPNGLFVPKPNQAFACLTNPLVDQRG